MPLAFDYIAKRDGRDALRAAWVQREIKAVREALREAERGTPRGVAAVMAMAATLRRP